MSGFRVAQFLNSGPKAQEAEAATPEVKLLRTLQERRMIPIPELSEVTGLPARDAIDLAERLRSAGQAVLLERPLKGGEIAKYLGWAAKP